MRIWVVGASARAAAELFVAAGHEVVASDLFGDADLQAIAETHVLNRYPDDAVTHAEHIRADAWLYTGGFENYPEIVERLAEKLPLIGNAGDALKRVRDPRLLRDVLSQNGFHFSETHFEVPHGLRTGERWLIKKENSSGGLGVRWAAGETSLARGDYLQRFIAGTSCSAAFIADRSRSKLVGVYQAMTDREVSGGPEFAYVGSRVDATISPQNKNELTRLGEVLQREFQLRGWFGVDLQVDEAGRMWTLEVNPRFTASMELFPNRAAIADAHVRSCQGEVDAWLPDQPPGNAAKLIVYARKDLVIAREASQTLMQLRSAQMRIADIPMPGAQIQRSTPLATLVYEHSPDEATLRRDVANVRQIIGDEQAHIVAC